MMTLGHPREGREEAVAWLRARLVELKLPFRAVLHRDAGIGFAGTLPGRGKAVQRERTAAYWRLSELFEELRAWERAKAAEVRS